MMRSITMAAIAMPPNCSALSIEQLASQFAAAFLSVADLAFSHAWDGVAAMMRFEMGILQYR